MKFTIFFGILGLVSHVFTTSVNKYQVDTEISEFELEKFESLIKELREYNAENFVPGYANLSLVSKTGKNHLEKRSKLPILDSLFVVFKNSSLCYTIIDFVLLKPPLLELVLNTTIWAIEAQLVNTTNLFIALDKSDLQLDILIACLQDPLVLPGLIKITKDLIKESGIKLINFFSKKKGNNKRESDKIEVQTLELKTTLITKRDDPVLNLLLSSLADSGLGSTLVIHILTKPELSPAAVHIMYKLLTIKRLTLGLVYDALRKSHLLWNVLRKILTRPQVLLKFGRIIIEKISIGEISATIIKYFE